MPVKHRELLPPSLVIDLALTIEDPAGIDAIELAQTIVEVFGDREGRQIELMRDSLYRWSLQWPRARTVDTKALAERTEGPKGR